MITDKKGFTLIELIVVMIILGVLASIAAPMITSIKVRAICSEAVTTMGAIRTSIKLRCLENPNIIFGGFLSDDLIIGYTGLNPEDVNGTYFNRNCYYVYRDSLNGFIDCYCDPTIMKEPANNAPKAEDTKSIADAGASGSLRMYISNGQIIQQGISRSGYPDHIT